MDFMILLSVLGILMLRFLFHANVLDIYNKKLKIYKKKFEESGNKNYLDRWFFVSLTKKAAKYEVLPIIYCVLNILNHVWGILLAAAEIASQYLTAQGIPLDKISNDTVYVLSGELLVIFICTALDTGAKR